MLSRVPQSDWPVTERRLIVRTTMSRKDKSLGDITKYLSGFFYAKSERRCLYAMGLPNNSRGIGALGTVILGILFFHEPLNLLRAVFLFFILIGILGLKLTSA